MIIINIGLAKTMTTELIKFIDNYTDIIVLNKYEIKFNEALNIDYLNLDKTKIYYYKNPLFIFNPKLEILIKKIEENNHKVILIFGVRNIIDNIYSLYDHWVNWDNGSMLKRFNCKDVLDIYNNVLSTFYKDIEKHLDFLKKHNTIIYNINNCKGTIYDFLKKMFDLMEIEVKIDDGLPNININITKKVDNTNLKEKIKEYNLIKSEFDKHFKNIDMIKL